MFDANDDQVILHNSSISCLMYADDLVLLSTSASGLQNCLNKLHIYCQNNGISVNLQKNKYCYIL